MEQNRVAAYYPNNVTTDHIQQEPSKAAIADSQFPASGTMQPGAGHHMRHQQAQPMTPHSLMASRASMLYAQQPFSALQQQQEAFHGQVGMSSGGSTGLNILQSESCTAGGSGALAAAWFPDFVSVSSGEAMHGGGRAIAGGRKLDVGSAVGSPEDRETADDGN
ncbi:hypothetical protein V6N11_060096 [Hibiscus sabdariffa]|uniref:Uncharacterized protein n=2 Tax=Hibiscus sabdariffa TaxID=183260 RepID=A0ABR2AD23_9ROSI